MNLTLISDTKQYDRIQTFRYQCEKVQLHLTNVDVFFTKERKRMNHKVLVYISTIHEFLIFWFGTQILYDACICDNCKFLVQALYKFGARKIIVAGVGQIGCMPYQVAQYTGRNCNGSRCNEEFNNAVDLFNTGLRKLVDRFNSGRELPGSKFVYLDLNQASKDLILNGASYGNSYSSMCFLN